LQWSDTAVSINFGGEKSFQSWSTKAQVLDKLGKHDEADAIMKKALPFGNEFEVHQYAKQLMASKKYPEALAVFKMNYDAHPGIYITTGGLVRGYSAMGNYTEALKYAQLALPLAPPGAAKAAMQKAIDTLKAGKDMNQ